MTTDTLDPPMDLPDFSEQAPEQETQAAHNMAEAEFDRFCNDWDLDTREEYMTKEQYDSFLGMRAQMIRAFEAGRARLISGTGPAVVEYTPKFKGEPMTFHLPTGATYMAMDRIKKDCEIEKSMAFMASMAKSKPGTVAQLQGTDQKFVQAIAGLFMAL